MRISDWSSDVCSSDLKPSVAKAVTLEVSPQQAQKLALASQLGSLALMLRNLGDAEPEMVKTITTRDLSAGEANNNSEERRVGKECVSTCRSGLSPSHTKTNN